MPRARMNPDVKARLLADVDVGAPDGVALNAAGRNLVVEMVRHWVFEGLLRDGDVISQDDLADILGLSRIPVRDGLIALQAAGWVVISPGVGARSVGLDAAAVRDSFALFASIWSLLIRRAVERREDPKSLLDAAAQVKEARTASSMGRANDGYVRALRALASAPRLDAAFDNAGRIVPGNFFRTVPDALRVQRQHVPNMAQAISQRNAEEASAVAVSQHRMHAQNIIRLLTQKGVLS